MPIPPRPRPVPGPTDARAPRVARRACVALGLILLLAAAPAGAQPALPSDTPSPPSGAEPPPDTALRLISPWVGDLQALRREQATLRARTADLELSLRHSEQRIVGYGALAVLFLTARAFLRWAIRRWRRWSGFNPRIQTMGLPGGSRPDPHEDGATEAIPSVVPAAHGADAWLTSALDGPPRRPPPSGAHPAPPATAPVAAASAVWGEPDLRLAPHLALLHSVDEWTAQGRWGEAVVHLESALHNDPAKSAWLLLKLLDLYQQLQEFHPHERVALQLMAIYRVRVPVATAAASPAGAGSGADPPAAVLSAALEDLHRHWGHADVGERFRIWLVRGGADAAHPALDRHGFERVLTLCALALEPHPHGDSATDRPPATANWSLAA